MKNLLFGLIATFLFTNFSFGQDKKVVGRINDGKFVLNFVAKPVLDKINTETKGNYSKIDILEGFDTKNKEKYYYLLIQNVDNSASIAFSLELNSQEFIFYSTAGSVNCTGCSYSCNPEKLKGDWYCTNGCGSNCTKSVTITTKLMFSHFQI